MERRKELAVFLKTRRTQLTPQEVGLPETTRRRTPGLRREEVAQLAAVGLTWYTWLEQGRNISVSRQVLHGVARALQLSEVEQQHLFTLAKLTLPETIGSPVTQIDARVKLIVHDVTLPTLLINQRWDILDWNDAMQALSRNLVGNPKANILYNMLVHAESRKRLVNWEEQTKNAIGLFRAETSKFVETDWYLKLIADLTTESAEFRRWWPQQKICQAMNTPKHYRLRQVGDIHVATTFLNVQDCPHLKLVINTPVDKTSARKLTQLIAKPDLA